MLAMNRVSGLIKVDRSSPVPLYFQVAQRLEELIESGEMPPGHQLENEISLADQLGLSRPTMRQAIQRLVDKGLRVRKRGVGTQVAHPPVRRQVELSSLYDDLERTHRQPRTEVLSFAEVPAPDEVAVALRLPEGAPVMAIERLRYAQDEPLALMHNYLPPGIADQTISARRATPTETRLLHEVRGAPLLAMSRTAYDHSGRAVEYGSHVYRASRYSFELTLVSR